MTSKNAERPTILLVDDALENIGSIIVFLEGFGFRTATAPSGKIALKQAAHLLPDLILLDVLMPDMDGFETCRRLKEHAATRNIPVIFLTALSETY